ncbi:MAG: UDP-glucose/GDP-mannose dehydrogenase family protein [Firmicutes bacterium]|nr:UDP-glucose/GDP-mannose dehydrogenase family protein [Bacillota bacterium]
MKLAIVGTGHVGLISGACFAEVGHHVVCIDIDQEKIKTLQAGNLTIHEPGLEDIVKRNVGHGRLLFTSDIASGIAESEVVFIVVGTPPLEDGKSDLSYVYEAAAAIGKALRGGYTVVAVMSTVPVGTSSEVEAIIKENLTCSDGAIEFDVASNPEFLREGTAVFDRMHPHRIVVGVNSKRAADILSRVYEPYNAPIWVVDRSTSELAKYACNAFLATKISFINEIANICELTGANVEKIAKIMGQDPRIGPDFLKAGIGYGGSCFPKDTRALDHIALTQGHNFELLKAVIKVNNIQKERFVEKIRSSVGSFTDKTIAVFGLSFKPNTDDVREAPALWIIRTLLDEGARVRAYDPVAVDKAVATLGKQPGLKMCASPYEAAEGADLLAIVTEWDEFKKLDLSILRSAMKHPVVYDGRNIYSVEKMAEAGFEYYSVGRPVANNEHVTLLNRTVKN